MKAILLITSFVSLSLSTYTSAQTGFANPDGRPNTVAIEPLVEYVAGGPFDADLLQLSLGIIVPVSERVTVRAFGAFGTGEYFKPQAFLFESGSRLRLYNGIERTEHDQVGIRLSVRIWLGRG